MKIKKLCQLSAMIGLLALSPVLADNPLISQKYTADPQAFVWNDRLYVYCSRDDNNILDPNNSNIVLYEIVDYTLLSTDDMANWTDHGEVFKVPRDARWVGRAFAPGVAVRNGKIYLYVPNGTHSIGVVTADRPEGPFTDPLRISNNQTGNPFITRTTPNCNLEWLFDPAAFIDDDGSAYLYFGGGPGNDDFPGAGSNLRVGKLNDNLTGLSGTAQTITGTTRSFEAAYMHKRGSTYYFTYSSDFSASGGPAIDYMTGTDPMGPFTYRGAILPNPRLNNANINRGNNNHASILEYKGKWYIVYHDRRISNDIRFRNVSVDTLGYNADGTIKSVVVTADGPPQIKNLNPYDTIRATTINAMSGIKTDSAANAGMVVTQISNNDYIRLKGVDFENGATKFIVRASCNTSGSSIELRTGSATGTLIGTCVIASTGSVNTYGNFEAAITNASGVKDYLYLVFKGGASAELFRLAWYKFEAPSAAAPVTNGQFWGQAPLMTVKGRTLNVNAGAGADAKVRVRVVNMTGKTVANFNASGNAKLSLKKIPAGAYVVEARRAGDGYKTASAVTLR